MPLTSVCLFQIKTWHTGLVAGSEFSLLSIMSCDQSTEQMGKEAQIVHPLEHSLCDVLLAGL